MSFLKKHIDIIFLAVIILIPTVFWWQVQTIDIQRISSLISGIGEFAGISGTVLFSLSLILSARPIFLDRFFGGLNRLYNYHSKIGQIAFILLLLHPLLLLSRYAVGLNDAAAFFLLSNNWQKDFGILSLYLTILVIILTLYLRPKYHIWKHIHKLLGVALILGALHIYLSPSYVLHSSAILNGYVLAWVIAGIAVWLYKSVFGKNFVKTYEYVTRSIVNLNQQIMEIGLYPKNKKIDFIPGQFVFVNFRSANLVKEKHPFSITSLPSDKILKLTIKSLGDFTSKLKNNLVVLTPVSIEGPFGSFSYKEHKQKKQIWIAGGIGVTPFISMAADLRNNRDFKIQMYYAVTNESAAIHLNLFKTIENNIANFTIKPFFSNKNGFITAEYIASGEQDLRDSDILICAPPTMIHVLKNGFRELGVADSHLYSEEFDF